MSRFASFHPRTSQSTAPQDITVNSTPKDEVDGEIVDTVIIHIHGGGFLGGSSSTMQSYTRRWANALGATVLAIDYCKPPEHRFPEPLEDVATAYHFIT